MDNSILEELHAIRDRHASSLGYDLDRIYADLKAGEARHVTEGWRLVAPPASPPQEADRQLQRTRFDRR